MLLLTPFVNKLHGLVDVWITAGEGATKFQRSNGLRLSKNNLHNKKTFANVLGHVKCDGITTSWFFAVTS